MLQNYMKSVFHQFTNLKTAKIIIKHSKDKLNFALILFYIHEYSNGTSIFNSYFILLHCNFKYYRWIKFILPVASVDKKGIFNKWVKRKCYQWRMSDKKGIFNKWFGDNKGDMKRLRSNFFLFLSSIMNTSLSSCNLIMMNTN